MTGRFEARKKNILEQLGAPDDTYHDLSPKGSVDEPIRELIGEINHLEGLVTTSSCSGRISVFLEGRKGDIEHEPSAAGDETRAGPGGKGGGGTWLYISHEAIDMTDSTPPPDFMSMFGMQAASSGVDRRPSVSCRFIHLKFEPMILHVLTASMDHAQRILTSALTAGFRESGAVSLGSSKAGVSNPMVAVRSTGYSVDCIIGYHDAEGKNIALVDESSLHTLVGIANERFTINTERIARFRKTLLDLYRPATNVATGSSKADWEDADARKRRKREEGLARQRALQGDEVQDKVVFNADPVDSNVDGFFQ